MELSWIMTVRLAVRQFCAFVQRHTTGQNDYLCMQVKKQVLKRKKKDLYWRSGNMRLFLLFIYFNWSIADLQLIYVSGVQQRDLVIHIPVSIYLTLFQILFSYRSLQNIEQHSLCYPAGTYLSILSILYGVSGTKQRDHPPLFVVFVSPRGSWAHPTPLWLAALSAL